MFRIMAALALALGVALAACEGGWLLAARLAEPPGLAESRAAVIRNARAVLGRVRAKYGTAEPDDTWGEGDRQVYANMAEALRREGEAP